jgi:glycerol transport system ATP-binding protein
MAQIELQGVAHRYAPGSGGEPGEAVGLGATELALDEVSHVFRDGVAAALLGPSGCGKTTLLSIISGLLRPTRGCVLLNGVDVTDSPPRERRVAQVFQFPVVYETMTVFDNLAFPLRNDGVNELEIRRRVPEVAEALGLEARLGQKARALSADERQTVSLGRGLVRSDVAAILLDEPLTVIDPQRRWEIRRKLRQIHRRSSATMVYVTHDQTEALTFADEVVVMKRGRVLQVGTPKQLFERPQHTFVGHFIGSPGMNFLPCRVAGSDALVDSVRVPLGFGLAAGASAGDRFELGIRPEFLELDSRPAPGAVRVQVRSVAELGDHRLVTVALGDHSLVVRVPEGAGVPADSAFLLFPPQHLCLYREGQLVS